MPTPTATTEPSPLPPMKLDHAAIRVPDFDTAIAWYSEKLDFHLTLSVPLAGLTFGLLSAAGDHSFHIELLAGPGAANRPSYSDLRDSYKLSGLHHLGFRVENVDETVDALKQRGVTIITEPRDVIPMGLRVAFFTDPWDNIFEIIHAVSA